MALVIKSRGSGLVIFLFGPGHGVGVGLGVSEHAVRSGTLDVEFVVLVDEGFRKERLVTQPPVHIVGSDINASAVPKEVERIIEVRSGVGVLAVIRVEAPVDLIEFGEDTILLAFEECERRRVGVVCLQQAFLLMLEAVSIRSELLQFGGFVGHEPVELVMEHPVKRILSRGRDLDSFVVALNEKFDVADQDRLPGAGVC